MDMESAKSDVNGLGKNNMIFVSLYQKVTRTKKMFQKRIDPIYIRSDQSFYFFFMFRFKVDPNLKSKSSLLQLDFLDLLIAQYSLHTQYTTQKNTKHSFQNVQTVLVLKLWQVKKNIRIDQMRFDIKVLFLPLDFGHKSQSGVLAETSSV